MLRPTPLITVDFETHPILARPDYPPRAVGVAVRARGRSRYYAWGHPIGNTATRQQAVDAVGAVWRAAERGASRVLMHHASFDLCVCEAEFGFLPLSAEAYEDTLPLAFLAAPDAPALGLKPLAAQWLGRAASERDAVQEWLRVHDPESRRSLRARAARIAYAPGTLVGPYACADVEMTEALYHRLYTLAIDEYGMADAYLREKRLVVEVLLPAEARGIPVALAELAAAAPRWHASLERTDAYLRRRLRTPGLILDKREALADALERSGELTEWLLTEKGARSTAVDDLALVLRDPTLVCALDYRARLASVLRVAVDSWVDVAQRSGRSCIYTQWQPVRNAERGPSRGTRTGRLASTPNMQNIPKRVPSLVDGGVAAHRRLALTQRAASLALPRALYGRVESLPVLRQYIVPRDHRGCLVVADYNQQELRILAHYAGGALRRAYREQPMLDLHEHGRLLLTEAVGVQLTRAQVKPLGFGIIYGLGLSRLAEQLGCDRTFAGVLRSAYKTAFPGLPELEAELRRRGAEGTPIYTWGGRRYVCEAPREVAGVWRTWEYKLINTLIQGTAGDVLKCTLLRLCETLGGRGNVLLTVHDEIVVDTDARSVRARREVAQTVRATMEEVQFSVPMPTSVGIGDSWANYKEVQ